jgi:thiol-disulfide isomerase/thioredoxin
MPMIRPKILAGLGVAAAALVGAGLYGFGGGSGNGGDAGAVCTDTAAAAARLDPLVGGEVAAFLVAERGDYLGDLAFTGEDGAPKTLADFAGRIVLVNLWATWCAPCRQEMPALDRLAAAAGGEDFAVVPISIDTGSADKPKAFLDSIGVANLPLYTDPTTEIFQEMKRRSLALGLPVTLLLDRKGCRLGHINGPAEWDSDEAKALIEAAVKEPPAV